MTRFTALVTPHLRALHLHCYRMLGSYADADEALQDTLLRAWQSFGTFADRAPLLLFQPGVMVTSVPWQLASSTKVQHRPELAPGAIRRGLYTKNNNGGNDKK